MLSFFKSVSPTPTLLDEKLDSAIPAASSHDLPPVDLSTLPATRPSDASIPTIDSAPTIQAVPSDLPAASLAPPSSPLPQSSVHTGSESSQSDQPLQVQSQSVLPYSPSTANSNAKDPRRFSLPSFSFLRSDPKQNKLRSIPPPIQTHPTSIPKSSEKMSKPSRAFSALIVGSGVSSEKRAKASAAIVRSVIIGAHNYPVERDPRSNLKSKSLSKADVARVKSQLLAPKSAAKVISQLKELPPHAYDIASQPHGPIRAVCLDKPDKDVHEQNFAQIQSVATAAVSTISTAIAELHLIDLVTAPNMGFGAPVTAQGLFAGAVPTAETVVEGLEQITPQLMALGYATGKAIIADHKGVIVPVDRISALTYWWGFEICLPPPTMHFLAGVESPGSAILNLLTAISVVNEGVREIIPFIRYIAQFVQSEWSLIKKADRGKGVVCTATWLLPVALVPQAWDFPDPPPSHAETAAAGQTAIEQSTPTSPSVNRFSSTLTTPKPSTEVPNGARSSSAYSTDAKD
ncbi:hypothetical protein JVU11DRAFT_2507 [Chiua virens]|nr:hypothetical protein JVU11DRAFT_2507 [Chiua virens]